MNHKPLNPPDGGTIRIEGILSGLRTQGHDVLFAHWEAESRNYLSFNAVTVGKPKLGTVHRLAKYLYGGTEGSAALDLILCNLPSLFARIRSNLGSCSVLQAEQIWSALLPLMYRKAINKVSVLDDHNVEAALAMRLSPYFQNQRVYQNWVRYVSALESTSCRLADIVVVTSELEKRDLERLHHVGQKKIRVIPNGTDLKKYRPDPELAIETRKKLQIDEESPILAYVGRFAYPPNELAIRYIRDTLAPALWKTHPDSRFLLISRDLPEGFLARSDRRIIEVKDDSDYPYINVADVCLAPLEVGGGTRLKVANYLACGKAVVSTPIGCEGIPAKSNKEVIITELQDFPDRVAALLDDKNVRDELCVNARSFAEKSCSWEASVSAFEHLFENLRTVNGK